MKYDNYDFSGWVTKNDLRCSDGRVIRRDAFAHQDGEKVPLVWMHNHNDPELVLGHTFLENRSNGVYGYSYLNDSAKAKAVKVGLSHGDYDSYSIFANHLQESGKNVYHGDIKEVSLVLSGANPGACIENLVLSHSDGDDEILDDEAIIYTGVSFMKDEYIRHEDQDDAEMENEPTLSDNIDSLLDKATDEEREALSIVINSLIEDDEYDPEEDEYDEEYDDEYDPEEDEYDEEDEYEMSHDDMDDNYYEGDETMKNNIFDGAVGGNVLTHSDFENIMDGLKAYGSLRDSYRAYVEENCLAHDGYDDGMSYATGTQEYGFNDPDMLFPDYKALSPVPTFIKRDDSWVSEFWGKVHRVPFQRIKSLYADITEDTARAKGYQKGNLKKEEFFATMKRTTDATTVYKKQKLDKQDIDDITDFDVVVWIRAEMRVMLNEEIARAALIGDGRSNQDEDKIDETKIRPIYKDSEFFVIRRDVVKVPGDPDATMKNIIRGAVKARKDYKGSGNTTWFTTEDFLTDALLMEDKMGHRLYKTEAELAAAMRVSKIVTVEVMEGLKDDDNKICAGIIVNPADYTVGSNHGGKIDMFDDFDLDYNQFKYLLETRCSGCLTKYHSAIILNLTEGGSNP